MVRAPPAGVSYSPWSPGKSQLLASFSPVAVIGGVGMLAGGLACTARTPGTS